VHLGFGEWRASGDQACLKIEHGDSPLLAHKDFQKWYRDIAGDPNFSDNINNALNFPLFVNVKLGKVAILAVAEVREEDDAR